MKRLLAATILSTIATFAYAEDAVNGKVVYATALSDGNFLFHIAAPQRAVGAYPTCLASNNTNRFIVPMATDFGKAAMTVLMTAYVTGVNVIVAGAGTCPNPNTWSAETVAYVYTVDQ